MELEMTIGIFLLIAGFVLLAVEMLLPGFGLPGVSGIVCLILGILFSADTIEEGLTITVIVVVILVIMFTVILTLLHVKKVKPPIVLEQDLKIEKGYLSVSDLEYLIGKEGVTSTDLRPAGKCNIEGVEFDVRSEGKYIPKGCKVRISRVQGNTLIIQEI